MLNILSYQNNSNTFADNSIAIKMIVQFKIAQPTCTYLRDPQETKLGSSIIQYSILLIHEIGFERFTFKKLSESIGCTEASVYRYFQSKQQLLLFLFSWYWGWMNYRVQQEITSSKTRKSKPDGITRIFLGLKKVIFSTCFANQFSGHDQRSKYENRIV